MNTALWVLQGLLGVAFLGAGLFKLSQPREKLVEKGMKALENYSGAQVKLIALAEVCGALGLVLPRLTGIVPVLTPIAALCLLVLMIGATVIHLRRKEPPITALFAVLLAVVAVGRFLLP